MGNKTTLGGAKVGIVTGAGRGIGREIALGLIVDGFSIAGASRTMSELKEVQSEAEKIRPDSFFGVPVDVADHKAVIRFVNEVIAKWGRVDLLVNNAGIYQHGTSGASFEDFSSMLATNLSGPFSFVQQVVPAMRRQRSGLIVNISSLAGVTPYGNTGAYSATKAGLNGLSQALFKELAGDGISVCAICPSWVNTELSASSPIAAEEMIQPKDILQSVRFLMTLSPGAVIPEIVIHCRQAVR